MDSPYMRAVTRFYPVVVTLPEPAIEQAAAWLDERIGPRANWWEKASRNPDEQATKDQLFSNPDAKWDYIGRWRRDHGHFCFSNEVPAPFVIEFKLRFG